MKEPKWSKLMEVFGRDEAELIKSYLEAHGIGIELIQEAYYQYKLGSASTGRVEILVPNYQLDEAQKLYAASGWNFDITETDDDEDDLDEEEDQE
jgi:hypothetical protein